MKNILWIIMPVYLLTITMYIEYSHRVAYFNRVAEDVLQYGDYVQWDTEDAFDRARHVTPGYKNPILILSKEHMTI